MNVKNDFMPVNKILHFFFISVQPPAKAQQNNILIILTQSRISKVKVHVAANIYFSFLDHFTQESRVYCLSDEGPYGLLTCYHPQVEKDGFNEAVKEKQ